MRQPQEELNRLVARAVQVINGEHDGDARRVHANDLREERDRAFAQALVIAAESGNVRRVVPRQADDVTDDVSGLFAEVLVSQHLAAALKNRVSGSLRRRFGGDVEALHQQLTKDTVRWPTVDATRGREDCDLVDVLLGSL